ncbi:ankyrin repeat protein [Colletotrichum sojae]|uniref:Ankyrin repeat protein n=1 Tax=Colletotrichum sojae TaxID=2175907 RepID=A0A8H6J3S3_9PEZI|nr:ankyrin repeat protein [Colletotrichum sojae]
MTESRPRPHRFSFRWVPHFPVYNEAIEDPKKREAANQIARERGMLQLYEEEYRHLPPLPPQLPHPLYEMQDPPGYRKDDASRAFYKSCAEGNLDLVRIGVPEPHYRCFRRGIENHHDDLAGNIKFYSHTPAYLSSDSVSESIFTSGSRELLPLLRVLVDSGWHPNQLLGPTQRGKRRPFNLPCQEVGLHYPRCILDTEILRFLLDAGADPTTGREVNRDFAFGIVNRPVRRLKGHILEMAVNLGAAEAVDLLVSHGARPEHGVTLHSLIRRRPDPAAAKVMDEEYREELCEETPWLEYPTLFSRFAIAQ